MCENVTYYASEIFQSLQKTFEKWCTDAGPDVKAEWLDVSNGSLDCSGDNIEGLKQ